MARGKKSAGRAKDAEAYKYAKDEATRKNNPESGMVDYVSAEPSSKSTKSAKSIYCWDPRESPQLVWAGKAGLKKVEVEEETSLEVPLVNLHIHERVATSAILCSARREDAQRSLFADPELDFNKEIQFYQHDVDWSNRMILGDSLLVMNSLLEREGMRGAVQCIYMDPPYGIKYASNFQPRIDQRDVKDGKDEDLTREVMQVQAFRDTWELGVHSYLTYLRDRLLLSRELLADSGSIFVQIGDENVHRVRCLMDEVFGEENFCGQIVFLKTTGKESGLLDHTFDFLLWFAKDKAKTKFRQTTKRRFPSDDSNFRFAEDKDGSRFALTKPQMRVVDRLADEYRIYRQNPLTSQSGSESTTVPYEYAGITYRPKKGGWKTNATGLSRLAAARRLEGVGQTLTFIRFIDDFPYQDDNDVWEDTRQSGFGTEKTYAVTTAERVIERCILMTTDPGDLVLDPTCGSGTTAYVAEQWGRRWITMDTSRVALAIARHRLMTAAFDYYKLRHPTSGVSGGFVYKTVPHITLKSIAQNTEIDKIAEEFQPKIEEALRMLNVECGMSWKEWEVPRELPSDIRHPTSDIHDKFWTLKREMQARIDASIAKNAPTEELVDQPQREPGIVRVSGPFTMEAVPNVGSEYSVTVEEKVFGEKLQMQVFEEQTALTAVEARNVSAYLSDMIAKLAKTGVVAKSGKKLSFTSLRPVDHAVLHAEGEMVNGATDQHGQALMKRVGIVFGPQNGSISESHVKEALASGRRYDVLLLCGYDFTPTAQEMAQAASQPDWQVLLAYVAPDTVMTDLLKDTKASQLFTMIGEPDVVVYRHGDPDLPRLLEDAAQRSPRPSGGEGAGGEGDVARRAAVLKEGEVFIELRGVDLYDPLSGEVKSDAGENVHAIFIDQDYDGKSFCICQALFPNKKDSWTKIARNLKGTIDEEAFSAFRTLVSLPFKPGTSFDKERGEGRVQIKVIDQRGNAVVKTVRV
ncbi:MAG: site-specific DNA-methyltransferase [Fimbriimonadaceae bacterium]|nr:site-specific DNA-methyltransferase [Fimbriimonadaceae bacterium]NUM39837.1 site-specific DNA-methyltransferase [Armatimonadota bacterium]